ncbi:MAG: ABC transporter ATP-binding protein, partial [Lachnospiraceae bacterium]
TCDRAAIIKNGDIVTTENIDTLKQQKQKYYKITFSSKEQTDHFANTTEYQVIHQEPTCITVSVPNHINDFLKALTAFDVIDLNISSQSLEDIFLHYYGGDQS